MKKPLAIIVGAGPGTGTALAKRFNEGDFQVAVIARNEARLRALADNQPGTITVAADVTKPAELVTALESIESKAGTPTVVVHNAVGGSFGTYLEIDPATLAANFEVNVMSLLHLARWALPRMQVAGRGSLIVTGNTSSQRGKANFAGFAPTKAAQRILAESIAREAGPLGIHVSYLLIDAVIDLPWTREKFRDADDDFFITPAAIAEEAWHIAHQPKAAWSFLVEIRPFKERW